MKKYFCFHCQKEVQPIGLQAKKLNLLFCPKCLHRITDDGNGFYRICDNCGVNTAPSANICPKCGYIFDAQALSEQKQVDFIKKFRFYDVVFGIALISVGFIAAFVLFYISFYVLIFMIAVLLLGWLLNGFRRF